MKMYLLCCFLLAAIVSTAQTNNTALLPDQNPNYLISQNKYMQYKDSLLLNQNTTVQQTYKAYDWYTAKLERKHERREFRREIRLANAYNNNWNNNWNWNNGWNNNRWNTGWRNNWFLPNIGYRWGDWFFGF
ncbi:MAG: hypothetical protein ACOVNY_11335 [Chitinophagaceae bacterium]